jgi:hypothetical protein
MFRQLSKTQRLVSTFLLSSLGSFTLHAASCPITQGGYLGNQGVVSGNCENLNLPPLSAFGSLSVNQNAPLNQVNRLNPNQLPITNNFQNFQNPCAITQNQWGQFRHSPHRCNQPSPDRTFPSIPLSHGPGIYHSRL